MGFLDKVKQQAEQAAERAKEGVADVQTKRELSQAYNELGEKAYELASTGAISNAALDPIVERIRSLKAKLEETGAPAAAPDTETPPASAVASTEPPPASNQPPAMPS
jgi:hypothetical protein